MAWRTVGTTTAATALAAGMMVAVPAVSQAADECSYRYIQDSTSCAAPGSNPDARVALSVLVAGGGGGSATPGNCATADTVECVGGVVLEGGSGGGGGLVDTTVNLVAGTELNIVQGRGGLKSDYPPPSFSGTTPGHGAGGGGSTALTDPQGRLIAEVGGGGGGAVPALVVGSPAVSRAGGAGGGGGIFGNTAAGADGVGECSGRGGNAGGGGAGGAAGNADVGQGCPDGRQGAAGGSSPYGDGGDGGTPESVAAPPAGGGAGYHNGGNGGGGLYGQPGDDSGGGGGGGGYAGGGGGISGVRGSLSTVGAGGGGGSFVDPAMTSGTNFGHMAETPAGQDGMDGFVSFYASGPVVLTEKSQPKTTTGSASTTSEFVTPQPLQPATESPEATSDFEVRYSTDCTMDTGVQSAAVSTSQVKGPGTHVVTATYTGLQPDTVYCYQAVGTTMDLAPQASDSGTAADMVGVTTRGAIHSFRTASAVTPTPTPTVTPTPSPTPTPTPTPTPRPTPSDYLKVKSVAKKGKVPVGEYTTLVKRVTSSGKTKINVQCRVGGAKSGKVCDIKINRKKGRVKVKPSCNDNLTVRVRVAARYNPGRDTWKRTWKVKASPRVPCTVPGNG